ncbi:MAG: DNA-directed RNA polymerase subunit omega [Clostridia bacterium]|nr:DNA-directed RNA polymerase subunit omega [Clostridia bacterium]
MIKVSVEDMLSGKESRYALVMGVAKRAREINDVIVENNLQETTKPVNLAIEDFKEGTYSILEPENNEDEITEINKK